MNHNNQELFEILRQKRNEIALRQNIEPFKVLHNKTLQEIAKTKPSTAAELMEIKGMGLRKVEKYGWMILEVVDELAGDAKTGINTKEQDQEKIFSVSEFIQDLNFFLVQKRATILGEVGQVSPRGGYLFFKLKDKKEEAVLNCFVWRRQLENFGIDLEEGLELKVSGYPRIYPPRGNFTFEVEQIGLVGEGALKQAFEKLKRRLESQGYFAIDRKRPLPRFVDSIGLITSQFADAKTDFLEHLGNFGFKIYFLDVRVEGIYAPDEIVAAIKRFNEDVADVDVLVLTRGGGSLESLQAFNTEVVAKAIFGSRIPIITGIGHQADVTIADLVADVPASTPTHAARILSDPWRQTAREITVTQNEMLISFDRALKKDRVDVENYIENILENFKRVVEVKKQKLETLKQDVTDAFAARLRLVKSLLREQEEKLELASPLKRLKQGYSITKLGNRVIRSVDQLKIDDIINIRLFKGEALSQIKGVRNGKQE